MKIYLIHFVLNGQMTSRYFAATNTRKAVDTLINGDKISKDDIIAVYQHISDSNWN